MYVFNLVALLPVTCVFHRECENASERRYFPNALAKATDPAAILWRI